MLFLRKLLSITLCCAMLTGSSSSLFAADATLERVTFFGDSTTAHLCLRGGLSGSRVWSGVGSTVLFETVNQTKCVHLSAENRDMTLVDAVAYKKPQILVITLGVSGGAGILPKERFLATYRKMLTSVKQASPKTKIIVQSILPLSDRSVKYYRSLTKDAVSQANGWIRGLCHEMGIPYVDTHSLLIDPATGYLKAEYQNDEYMHLTSAAYAVMLANIKKEIQRLGY